METKRLFLTTVTLISFLAAACGDSPDDESDPDDTGTDDTDNDDTDNETDTSSSSDSESDTSDDGPISDLTTLIGKTYIVEIPQENWTQPAGVGSEIGGYVPYFAFEITNVTGTDLEILLGTADGQAQDMCNKTMKVTGVVDDNPHFKIGPMDFEAIVEGDEKNVIATVHDMVLQGQFTNQGAAFKRGTFNGVVDFRDIYELFTLLENPTPDSICTTAPSFGFQCEECFFDQQTYCISLMAENFKANEVPNLSLSEVAEMDETCL